VRTVEKRAPDKKEAQPERLPFLSMENRRGTLPIANQSAL
jgi:hypothetical protein